MWIIPSVIVFIIAFEITAQISNNIRAEDVAIVLEETLLSENTVLIESVSKAGKLNGNGNGMQYFGAILIKSELSLDELNAYYSQFRENEWEYVVDNQESENIEEVEHGNLSFSTAISVDDYYIVYSWGTGDGFFEYFDIRGH